MKVRYFSCSQRRVLTPEETAPSPPVLTKGAELWAAWHGRAIGWNGRNDGTWVSQQIIRRLPCGECARHAKDYLMANPPDYSQAGYFPWTVAFHNAVNARLGRPAWTLEEARTHWTLATVPPAPKGPPDATP